MEVKSQLARKIESGEFIVTAEHAPRTTATPAATEAALKALGGKPTAVNMGDNQYGVAMFSLAASAVALKAGVEPVLQMVTRDWNRIALYPDLLGAASLGITNVLCLSGYH
ncbi:MAG: methylenetetrahydrofolate reductase [Verrucomicrobia bacterium]|nr:methylenetetrahydrofolate reductase [Verrucomicrobiota bacterium]